MCAFYEDVVGLEVLRREESFVFFEIAEGYGGHSQNLALFDSSERTLLEWKSQTLSSDQSTLHHIALNIDPVPEQPSADEAALAWATVLTPERA
jgi:catechol-2,3-dioxygenase